MSSNSPKPSCVKEFEQLFEKAEIPGTLLWNYVRYATGEGQTNKDSIAAFKRFRFQPRILSAKRERSTWTTLLGHPVPFPIGISPVSGQQIALSPEGDIATGKAAAKAGALMIFTSVGDISIEQFAEGVPEDGLYWAQTYLFKDKRNTLHLVRNAERLGFKALVVTVDSPVHTYVPQEPVYTPDIAQDMLPTPAANVKYMKGRERESTYLHLMEIWEGEGAVETFCCADWQDLAWIQRQTKLPIVLKGILTADSARKAASTGIAGIIVSAHAGRQLDGVPAPLDALPEIVDAVKDTNVEVYMDGGVRTGNDVVKALALGARAVFIGKPTIWGLKVNGEDGVYQILKILEEELKICMALCGCSSIGEITRSLVKHESRFHSKL